MMGILLHSGRIDKLHRWSGFATKIICALGITSSTGAGLLATVHEIQILSLPGRTREYILTDPDSLPYKVFEGGVIPEELLHKKEEERLLSLFGLNVHYYELTGGSEVLLYLGYTFFFLTIIMAL